MLSRYHHNHDWLAAGFGIAAGWYLFRVIGALIGAVVMLVWWTSETWSPLWRRLTRVSLVVVLTLSALVALAVLTE